MPQVRCPQCGYANLDVSAYCARCDRPLKAPQPYTIEIRQRRERPTVKTPPRPEASLDPDTEPEIHPPLDADKTTVGPLPVAPPARAPQPPAERQTSPMPQAFAARLKQERARQPPEPDNATVVRAVVPPPEAYRGRPQPARGDVDASMHDSLTVVRDPSRPLPKEEYATLMPGRPDRPWRRDHAGLRSDEAPVERTVIPAASAPLGRLALAVLIDFTLVSGVSLIYMAAEMVMFAATWPATAGGVLDGLATWLSVYPSTAARAVTMATLLGFIYALYAGHGGRTVGRHVMGLIALSRQGDALSWTQAAGRAAAGLVSVMCFGAGFFWVVVDGQRRAWHDLVARSVVVSRR